MCDLGSNVIKCNVFFIFFCKVNVVERTCCCLFCKCIGGDGVMGDFGLLGKKVILVKIYGLFYLIVEVF